MPEDFPLTVLPERYAYRATLASGGFGVVCSAFDRRRVLQHTFVGNGADRRFQVSFQHLAATPEDSGHVRATVDEEAVAGLLLVEDPPGCAWPLSVELPAAPPAGAKVVIETHELVAIKCVNEAFATLKACKVALREVKLLRFLHHPNVLRLHDVYLHPPNVWDRMLIVTELLDTNLRLIIKSGQAISEAHASYFLAQILEAVVALHDADIVHRDLKPHNVLVNMNSLVKVCDFGMARFDEMHAEQTGMVATIWYRPAELLCDTRRYSSKAVDMWGVGTILGELLHRQPLFPGWTEPEMMKRIVGVLGPPSATELDKMGASQAARREITKMANKGMNFRKLLPKASDDALDLLQRLLVYDPDARLTAAEALAHPFCRRWQDEFDLLPQPDLDPAEFGPFTRTASAFPVPSPGRKFDNRFEAVLRDPSTTIETARGMFANELEHLRSSKLPAGGYGLPSPPSLPLELVAAPADPAVRVELSPPRTTPVVTVPAGGSWAVDEPRE